MPDGPAISVDVDPMNPGQFFGACGLLELADRLWRGAEGWFETSRSFVVRARHVQFHPVDLASLLSSLAGADLHQVDQNDDFSSPIHLGSPFDLRLDWWTDWRARGDRLKVWAGSMRGARIARAMKAVLVQSGFHDHSILDRAMVVHEPDDPKQKVEPFYFDARRGASSLALDIGFMPDSLKGMTTAAYPAVELLCLVGLQRFRPAETDSPRVFEYHTWGLPLDARVAPAAVCGLLPHVNACGYRFENAFRTGQKKHKAFVPATYRGGIR